MVIGYGLTNNAVAHAVGEVIRLMTEEENANMVQKNHRTDLPRRKRGAQRGIGVVGMLVIGVEITDDQ